MRGPQCVICDRGNCMLSERDFCAQCDMEFTRVMETIRCAEASAVCSSPISCLMVKKCVQMRAAVAVASNETGLNDESNTSVPVGDRESRSGV